MKIAVSTDDYITVCGHVGRCKGFMIYEMENGKILRVKKRENSFTGRIGKRRRNKVHSTNTHTSHHDNSKVRFKNHGYAPLAAGLNDCDILISLGTGWDMLEDLKQEGIKHIVSVEKYIEDAVEAVIKNQRTLERKQ
ncbi:MAG: hypothetical protein HND52_00715 [Ignavibacteriae bacterium]|nr:hypothetical protein [Ignavibacteriota bacterium]